MANPLDNFVGAKEAAKRLDIHPESVKRLIRQQKLPATKVGNKWLIQRVVLEQFASTYDPRPGQKSTLI